MKKKLFIFFACALVLIPLIRIVHAQDSSDTITSDQPADNTDGATLDNNTMINMSMGMGVQPLTSTSTPPLDTIFSAWANVIGVDWVLLGLALVIVDAFAFSIIDNFLI